MKKRYKRPKQFRVVRWEWVNHEWVLLPMLIVNYGWLDFETNDVLWDKDVCFFQGGTGIKRAELEKMSVKNVMEDIKNIKRSGAKVVGKSIVITVDETEM